MKELPNGWDRSSDSFRPNWIMKSTAALNCRNTTAACAICVQACCLFCARKPMIPQGDFLDENLVFDK